jgi:hypothetical protein
MTDNHCCFYDSGVFENVKLHGYSYKINHGNSVMLELDTNKRILYLFVNNVISTVVHYQHPTTMLFFNWVCRKDRSDGV